MLIRKIILRFIFLLGIGIASVALYNFTTKTWFVTHSAKTSGTVTRLVERVETNVAQGNFIHPTEATLYAPEFTFTANHNRDYTVLSPVASNPATFKQGEQISVYYNQDNPDQAVIASFSNLWLQSLTNLILAGVFIAAGLADWIAGKMRVRKLNAIK